MGLEQSWTRWRGRRECLLGWGKLQELREGTQGHCRARSALALNFLFPLPVLESVLGMPPLGNLPAGRGSRAACHCRVTVAHRHAVTPQLYMALPGPAGAKRWDL